LFRKYVFSLDHKVIGLQYALTSLFFLLIGFSLAVLFRWQLAYPGQPVPIIGRWLGELNAPGGMMLSEFYNGLVAMHGTVIVHLSSKDVIHSFGLPQMRVKQDAIPGIEQRLWFTPTRTGEWEIACSQLCGLGHYRMRGFYTIQTQADFEAWLTSQPAGL
jgi:heme/copper-type cytochrome/quinol oxidase subunit 2